MRHAPEPEAGHDDDDQMLDGVIIPALNNASRGEETTDDSSLPGYLMTTLDMPSLDCDRRSKTQSGKFRA